MNPFMLADYKAARSMHDKIAVTKVDLSRFSSIADAVEQCERWKQTVDKTLARNWQHAAHNSTIYLIGALEMLHSRVRYVLSDLEPHLTPPLVVTERDIFNDLQSLRSEFDDVTVELQEHRLTVRTDTITLEDISLGDFDIRLEWSSARPSFDYRVIAVDPSPAVSNSETTHPHVQSESLCEGEGATAIQRALLDGRIYDFFCIVDRILKNYNEGSAYVSLSDWCGTECSDCGCTVDADEANYCYRCQSDVCGECARTCCVCDQSRCGNCVETCCDCGDDCCPSCLKTCHDCDSNFCSHCLNKGKCHDCTDNETPVEPDLSSTLDPILATQPQCVLATASADVHAVCLE